jgi:hypothetical protein
MKRSACRTIVGVLGCWHRRKIAPAMENKCQKTDDFEPAADDRRRIAAPGRRLPRSGEAAIQNQPRFTGTSYAATHNATKQNMIA